MQVLNFSLGTLTNKTADYRSMPFAGVSIYVGFRFQATLACTGQIQMVANTVL